MHLISIKYAFNVYCLTKYLQSCVVSSNEFDIRKFSNCSFYEWHKEHLNSYKFFLYSFPFQI